MSCSDIRPIILVSGGSGGHVFPAIALAEYAHSRDQPVVLITDARGSRFIENDRELFSHVKLVPQLSVLSSIAIYGHMKRLYRQYQPKAILGFGGIMTVLPLLMARLYGIPCAIHQSDAVLGRANRLLAPWMNRVFVGHPLHCYAKHTSSKTQHKWHTIGTPIRQKFSHIMPHARIEKPLKILILGGSQGAKIWSTLLPAALSMLSTSDQRSIHIQHQSPQEDRPFLMESYEKMSLASFEVAPFFTRITETLSWAHVVFSRAGASTLAELAHCHRPAFLVPYPLAIDNHQHCNARSHTHEHRAWMYTQSELTPSHVATTIKGWLDKPEELLYGEKQIKMPHPVNACSELFSFCTST